MSQSQKYRLIVCALGASRPGTMGGNTKITIEMARCVSETHEVHVFLPQYKLPTFTNNLPATHKIIFHTLDDYPKDDKLHPFGSSLWYVDRVRTLFKVLAVNENDFVFGCSDFHIDVLPIYPLQREFRFRWIPSVFLFVPFITENLSRGYRFPAFKYLIYWFYQRALFFLMKRRATAFVVTNKSDFDKFPKRFTDKIFAYYGGVNTEQIPSRSSNQTIKQSNNPSVVFCSRLHPQKGIDAFLDTWKKVMDEFSTVHLHLFSPPHLTIIGNGEKNYEAYLKDKAKRLGITDSISWLGYVNNEAKYEIYAKSDLLVHPTVFDNNGMVAAEALCTGLPVVMQDLPALRDVYTTGCVKVPFGDRDAFAAAIVSLLTDPAKRSAIAPNPAQLAALRDHWCWESRADEFEHWVDTL